MHGTGAHVELVNVCGRGARPGLVGRCQGYRSLNVYAAGSKFCYYKMTQ